MSGLTYETVAQFAQQGGTLYFAAIFAGGVLYALWPRNGETFRRRKLYRVMIRYVAPVMMLVLFLQSTGILA